MTEKPDNTDVYGSERLTTENTGTLRAKVGTHTPRIIYIHEDDLPLSKGDHFRFLNGFHTQEPTEHGFYPEYGKVTKIQDDGVAKTYFIDIDGSGSGVESIQSQDESTENSSQTKE